MKILYVEDNPVDADLLRRSLARNAPDIAVELADSVAGAVLALAPEAAYDVILADLALPDGSGLDLLNWVRERQLPVAFVVLTGSGDPQAAVAALKAGADDYQIKGGDYLERLPRTLAAAVERAAREMASKSRPLRVLYAERNQFDADLTVRRLAVLAPHLRVDVVWRGDEVLERLPPAWAQGPAYDVLLLDYLLPGMNALDVTKAVRQDLGLDLPIVLVTGQGSEEAAAQALRLGVSDYLVKHAGYLQELPLIIDNAFRQVELTRERAALRSATARLREVLATSPAVNYTLRLKDGDWVAEWVSDNVVRMTGYATDEAVRPGWWLEHVHPDDRGCFDHAQERIGEDDRIVLEYRFRCADGRQIWVRDDLRIVGDSRGGKARIAGVWSDITAEREATERLRLNAAVIESTHDAVMITDLDANIVSVNRAFTELTGYRLDEVLGHNPRVLQSGRHQRDFYQAMWRGLLESGYWQGEVWNRRRSGEVHPVHLSLNAVRTEAGEVTHYVGVFTDLSKLRQVEARLDHLAHHDPLTDLPNRLLLLSRLEHALEVARRRGGRVAVMFLDLDRFATVNDSLGHSIGDELLRGVAARLRGRLRDEDTIGRLGGDEFMILLEHLDAPSDAAVVAGSLIEALAAPFVLPGAREVFIHASIGITVYPDDGRSHEELVRNADATMYRAKEQGRNTYRFYTEDLTRFASRRLDLETRLRRALAHDEFVLHYQPVIDIADGRLLGAEALIRWQPPGEAMVPPLDFIPIAEETGLIVAIGEWVIHSACQQARAWLDEGYEIGEIAVNLSVEQIRRHDVGAVLRRALADATLPAARIEIEITESSLMEQGEQADALLDELKRLGLRVAIDDFGTGYSSLAYLKRFSIDKLKIDRSFVKDLADDRNDLAIAAAIVAMARALEMSVQAEGVETEPQLALLRELGCGAYQGYLCSPPLPAEAFACRFLAPAPQPPETAA